MQEIQVSDFERTTDGQMAHLYRITNASGASVVLCDYGASVVSILVPDKQQNLRDVVLGYAHLSGYETGGEYFGASVGRCCNRIREGAFTLNGVSYQLAVNDGTNHLHGGNRSFSRRLWNASCAENRVIFQLESPDGEEQYPGNMQVTATYTWDDTNTLTIAYNAICDHDTLCNLTNHTYFQLDGEGRQYRKAAAAGSCECLSANRSDFDSNWRNCSGGRNSFRFYRLSFHWRSLGGQA